MDKIIEFGKHPTIENKTAKSSISTPKQDGCWDREKYNFYFIKKNENRKKQIEKTNRKEKLKKHRKKHNKLIKEMEALKNTKEETNVGSGGGGSSDKKEETTQNRLLHHHRNKKRYMLYLFGRIARRCQYINT